VKRTAVVFLVILGIATYLWPWLRELGLARLPGDVMTDIQGYRLHLPISTSLLITGAIAGAWRMLEPR
jgi:Protein of unknown function (DUF2905)